MNTSEFDKTNFGQHGIAEQLGETSLPDVDHLNKLANELFSALPCDGSRLNAASSLIPGGLATPASRLNIVGAGAITPQGFGLPGEAELQQLLVSRPPSGSSLADAIDPRSISTIPSTGAAHQLATELTPEAEKSVDTGLSPQALESEAQKLFAGTYAAAGKIPKNAGTANGAIPDYPTSEHIPGLASSLANLDSALIAGLSPKASGLPGEAELQQLFAAYSQTQRQIPASSGSSSGFYFLDEAKIVGFNAQALGSAHPPFDVNAVRRDFPILQERVNGHQLVWLDNAATTQKPQAVIDRLSYFYEHENSNIHRAAHELAARSTDAYEGARDTVTRFINADSSSEIIFVRGSTEAINLVAQSWGRQYIGEGDEIIISWLEHHANIVPWQQLCAETGAILKVIPVDDDGQVLLAEYQK